MIKIEGSTKPLTLNRLDGQNHINEYEKPAFANRNPNSSAFFPVPNPDNCPVTKTARRLLLL